MRESTIAVRPGNLVAVGHPGARDDLDPALVKEVSTNV